MFAELDPLMDFRCPHCGESLRFQRVAVLPDADPEAIHRPRRCPHCEQTVFERRHPAIANDWLWSRLYLPGVILCALGIFVPSLGWLLPFALVVLIAGLGAVIMYMLRERWGWKRYGRYSDIGPGGNAGRDSGG